VGSPLCGAALVDSLGMAGQGFNFPLIEQRQWFLPVYSLPHSSHDHRSFAIVARAVFLSSHPGSHDCSVTSQRCLAQDVLSCGNCRRCSNFYRFEVNLSVNTLADWHRRTSPQQSLSLGLRENVLFLTSEPPRVQDLAALASIPALPCTSVPERLAMATSTEVHS
jgi:hypothetical protein